MYMVSTLVKKRMRVRLGEAPTELNSNGSCCLCGGVGDVGV